MSEKNEQLGEMKLIVVLSSWIKPLRWNEQLGEMELIYSPTLKATYFTPLGYNHKLLAVIFVYNFLFIESNFLIIRRQILERICMILSIYKIIWYIYEANFLSYAWYFHVVWDTDVSSFFLPLFFYIWPNWKLTGETPFKCLLTDISCFQINASGHRLIIDLFCIIILSCKPETVFVFGKYSKNTFLHA